jgi:drug/metabolite transporter (DMT)-like permease
MGIPQGVAAALGAALLWVLATRLFQGAGERLSPLRLNAAKGAFALLLFSASLPLLLPGSRPPTWTEGGWLALSGVVGIGMGDTAYFRALSGLGTRRVLLLELLAAPSSVALAWLALGESLPPRAGAGLLLTLSGVGLAVAGGFPAEGRPALRGAVGWGLLAAACQGAGVVMARGAFRQPGLEPALAAWIRLGAGELVLLTLLALLAWKRRRSRQDHRTQRSDRPTLGLWLRVAGAAALGTWLGIWLQQASLTVLPAGVAQTLLATAPLFALALAALAGHRARPAAWAGAALALFGIFLLASGW